MPKTTQARPAVSAGPKIPFPARKVSRAVAEQELALLEAAYPEAVTALEYESPFTLLIAVMLSAQTTDVRVNLTTPFLFAKYPTPQALAGAPLEDVEGLIKSTGFYHNKAKNIIAASTALVERYGGDVPADRDALEALPGVGRKTANVVLAVAFEQAAFAVDTHVFRVAHRLGLTLGKTPRDVEDDVVMLVPAEKLRFAHHWLILHGRAICKAPVPSCSKCPVVKICPSAALVARALKAKAGAKSGAKTAAGRSRRGAPAAAAPRPARASSTKAKG